MRRETLVGVLWTSTERWAVRCAGLLTFVVLGRLLDPADFGLVALAAACVALLQVLAETGFSTWLVQKRTVDQRSESTCFWTSLAVSSLAATALVTAAGPLSRVLGAPELAPVLRVLSLGLLAAGLSSTPIALLTRAFRFRDLAIRQVSSTLAGCGAGLFVAFSGGGVWALVTQQLVQQIVAVAVLFATARWSPRRQFSASFLRDILRVGLSAAGIDVLQQVRAQGEKFLIGGILGVVALGYWTVASRLLLFVLDIALSVVSAVSAPAFLRLRDDRARLHSAYATCLSMSALLAGPILVGLAVSSPVLVPLVFGEQWKPSGPLGTILAVGGLAGAMSYFDRSVFLASGKLRLELGLVLFAVVIHLALVPIAAPFGLTTLAVVLAARGFLTWPLRLVVLHRGCGLPYRAQLRGATILLGCATAGAVTLLTARGLGFDDGWRDLLAIGVLHTFLTGIVLALTSRDALLGLWSEVRELRVSAPADTRPVQPADTTPSATTRSSR